MIADTSTLGLDTADKSMVDVDDDDDDDDDVGGGGSTRDFCKNANILFANFGPMPLTCRACSSVEINSG